MKTLQYKKECIVCLMLVILIYRHSKGPRSKQVTFTNKHNKNNKMYIKYVIKQEN